MTEAEINITAEVKRRLEERKKTCFNSPNPYYRKGEFPTEYQDLKIKIGELKKLIE